MDSVVLRAVYCWMRRELVGGKVFSVEARDAKSVFLTVRKSGIGITYIVISWDAAFYRLYPTSTKPPKSSMKSNFVAILRRHILGSEIASILMKSLERVVIFELVNRGLRGEPLHFTLIAELMGKNSNLVLLDHDAQTVLEAGKHVTDAMSRLRPILPGARYIAPPLPEAPPALSATEDEMRNAIEKSSLPRLSKLLLSEFSGISPTIAREIEARAEAAGKEARPAQAAVKVFHSLMTRIGDERFEPCIMTESLEDRDGEAPGDQVSRRIAPQTPKSMLCAFPFVSKSDWSVERFETMAEAAEVFYARAEHALQFERLRSRLYQMLKVKITRARRRLEKIEGEAADEAEVEKAFRKGELLKMNVHNMRSGAEFIEVQDVFSSPDVMISIPLDPSKSAWANVDLIFKKAKRARRRLQHSDKLTAVALDEIAYLEGILVQIESGETMDCLIQIADELLRRAIISKHKHGEVVLGLPISRAKDEARKFRRFTSSEGFQILVGRNNAENDELTLKVARQHDLFVHAQGVPGSHVIVRRGNRNAVIPKRTVEEAAIIAAHFSKSRFSQNVPVAFTRRLNVKKPKGALPGKVIYPSFETVFVNPDPELVARLADKAVRD